ncbi:hypothetical protein BU25DRAFT_446601 [Macroventuria anomochaeta]|uniref:Uncharacterized protein n=1 Tax=Macroventuria anomochaeta TaxID=301207 RepID=A0ACB6S8M8_9PLEO|nr:uncharacterized protein BU25DRAFT_446601 [Macroventuria anomochaeta]KAF2630362.1 hypothetical protein BU25DRAFT_446601 [Macroventuria anomochaeta]
MSLVRMLLDLSIVAWPLLPPNAFHGTDEEIDDFTFKLAESKLVELTAISTTSCLIAGIVAAIYSWPIYSTSPWPVKTFYGPAFIFSLVLIHKVLQQNYILRRLELHNSGSRTEAGDKVRRQLAKQDLNGRWVPSFRRQMWWNSSTLFLNLSIILLLAGYGCTIISAHA